MTLARISAGVLALLAAVASWRFFDSPLTGVDDANITLVYARNLAHEHGFVFTPGFERVEGFTSLLWTLLCALGFVVSDHPERLLGIVCCLLAAFCGVAVVSVAELASRPAATEEPRATLAPKRIAATSLVALGWLACLPSFYAWMAAPLMDVSLFAALVHALAWSVASEVQRGSRGARRALAIVGALLILTRPEALALVPTALLAVALAHRLGGRSNAEAIARVRAPFAVFLAAAATLTLFRLIYFGHPLPNTFYAKVSPDRWYAAREGFEYIAAWWRYQPLSLVLCVGALAAIGVSLVSARAGALAPSSRVSFAIASLCLAGLLLPLFGGGDHFGSFRFLQPFAPLWIVPSLGLALPPALRVAARRTGARLPAAALMLVAIGFGLTAWSALSNFRASNHLAHEFHAASASRALGESLGRAFAGSERPSVGTVVAGGLAYAYPGRVVDLMGLNWLAMGHSPGERKGSRNHAAFDPAVFWEQPPDLMTPRFLRGRANGCAFETEFEHRVLRGIHDDPRFEREYAAAYVDLGNQVVGGYVRRSWAERTRPEGLVFFRGEDAHCATDWSRHPARLRTLERGWRPIWER